MSPSSPLSRSLCLLLLVCIGLAGLSACTNKTSDGTQTLASGNASDADIAKYTAYVEALSQMDGPTASFAYMHDDLAAVLEGDRSVAELVWHDSQVTRLWLNLETAIALPGKVPTVDAAANALLQTVRPLQTPSSALEYDLVRKGYQDDDGAKSRELIRQLLPLLAEAAEAQYAFAQALEKEERALIEMKMEQAPEGSLSRYTITALYYGGRLLIGFFEAFEAKSEQQDIQHLLEQIQADIAAFDTNAQGYFAYMAEHDQSDGCMGSSLKSVLSGVRNTLEVLQAPERDYRDPILSRHEQDMDEWEISLFRDNVERPLDKLTEDYNLRCN